MPLAGVPFAVSGDRPVAAPHLENHRVHEEKGQVVEETRNGLYTRGETLSLAAPLRKSAVLQDSCQEKKVCRRGCVKTVIM